MRGRPALRVPMPERVTRSGRIRGGLCRREDGAYARPVAARWATFDCYGTLVDWNSGIGAELGRLLGPAESGQLLARYHVIEPRVQGEHPTWSYREVMAAVLAGLAAESGVALPPGERDALGRSLPGWPVFAEVPGALAETAQELGSYKPAPEHWRAFYASTGADASRHVHVAQSHFHDIVPAHDLGIPSIWINRLAERAEPAPTRELPDLTGLAGVLDELVPPG